MPPPNAPCGYAASAGGYTERSIITGPTATKVTRADRRPLGVGTWEGKAALAAAFSRTAPGRFVSAEAFFGWVLMVDPRLEATPLGWADAGTGKHLGVHGRSDFSDSVPFIVTVWITND